MKRIVIALAAVAVAVVAAVGVVRATGDSAPKPSTSRDQSSQDAKDQAKDQRTQMQIAQDELLRKTREYAKRYPPVTGP
ncbi:MAG: hypothetical protein JWR83_2373 [Aeromicrobium sp.]|nr:hypothetical protein [Aeromicrobium sp.]